MIYRISILAVLLGFSMRVGAQTEGSSFTLTGMGVSTPWARDYQALGINPANLGLESAFENKFTFGFFEGGLSVFSEALTKEQLRQNLYGDRVGKFTQEEQRLYAKEFANSKNALDIEFTHFGMSVHTTKLGTFGLRIRERANMYYELGPQISDLLWLGNTAPYFDSLIVNNNGQIDTIPNSENLDEQTYNNVVQGFTSLSNAQNISELLRGTTFRFSWVREFNLGWGMQVWSNESVKLNAGAGVKLMLGQGLLAIDGTGSETTVFSSLAPVFKIDYGEIAANNPSNLGNTENNFTPVGLGVGFDLGATMVFKDRLFLSAAVTDIGKMTWDGNVYQLNDIQLTSFDTQGLESTDYVDQFEELNGGDAILEWKGADKVVTDLPTTLRLGAGFTDGRYYKIGVDVISPFNNSAASLEKAVIAIGGEFSPLRFVHLQAGYVQGGNYDTKIPVGIYFTLGERGSYEFGFASRDAITFFTAKQPTISMAFGLMRFRF